MFHQLKGLIGRYLMKDPAIGKKVSHPMPSLPSPQKERNLFYARRKINPRN
jgi:hypothetical protein